MVNAKELVKNLHNRGLSISRRGGYILVGPRSLLTELDKELLKEAKPELMKYFDECAECMYKEMQIVRMSFGNVNIVEERLINADNKKGSV